MGSGPPGSSARGTLQARMGCHAMEETPGHLPNPGVEPATPVSPILQENSLPSQPSGKPPVTFKEGLKSQPFNLGLS